MTGTIIKIHEPKIGFKGITFIRIEFEMEDKSWAKTDVCPSYRNYSKWKPIIEAGVNTKVSGLRFNINRKTNVEKKNEVNADSDVKILQ